MADIYKEREWIGELKDIEVSAAKQRLADHLLRYGDSDLINDLELLLADSGEKLEEGKNKLLEFLKDAADSGLVERNLPEVLEIYMQARIQIEELPLEQ